MPNTVISPNMGIVVPVNLVDGSPDWGARIQAALFATIDAHDHSSGKGVQITPAGLNIDADLGFGSFNATALRSSRYSSQGSPLALGSDVGCVYVSAGELWYNDLASRQVQLTQTGAVKSAPQALSFKAVTTSYTILSTDPFQLFYCKTGSGAVALALPSSATVAVGRVYYVVDSDQNSASNAVTISPNGSDTINGTNAAFVLTLNGGMVVMTTDAAGHWTANTISPEVANFTTIATTGGTVTPTALQLKSQVLFFTGVLASNLIVQLPNAPGTYTFDFSVITMGGFTVSIKSGTTTSAAMGAALIGTTATTNKLSYAITYGSNSLSIKA